MIAAATALAASAPQPCPDTAPRYVFSWPLGDGCGDRPRGGTTTGAPAEPDNAPHPGWLALRQPGLSDFERDRRAILAMAGPYRVSFDFLETVGFSENFERDKPYQSWATEYVYVLKDGPGFISLQHVMVMYFEQEKGGISEPMVMKHWRQDWTWQDDTLLTYDHRNRWRRETVPAAERRGQWSQAVYHVDDSPRYESIGRWQHNGSFSSWISRKTRRPLPRRESSVRSDYQVLEGYNRHTITRGGWVQEEENWKLVVNADGTPDGDTPYLAKELGVVRYRRVAGVDFTPGDRFMATAGPFWADVRAEWERVFARPQPLALRERVDGQPLFMPLFEYAAGVMEAGEYDAEEGRAFARETIARYLID
jgi:hypothetical protein